MAANDWEFQLHHHPVQGRRIPYHYQPRDSQNLEPKTKEGSSSRISTNLWDYNRQSSTGKTHIDSRSSNNAHERNNHHLKLTHHQGHCCLHRVRLPKFQTTRPSLALGAKISAGPPALIVDWPMSNLAYASRHYSSKEKSMLNRLTLSSVSEKEETTYFC